MRKKGGFDVLFKVGTFKMRDHRPGHGCAVDAHGAHLRLFREGAARPGEEVAEQGEYSLHRHASIPQPRPFGTSRRLRKAT